MQKVANAENGTKPQGFRSFIYQNGQLFIKDEDYSGHDLLLADEDVEARLDESAPLVAGVI
jgi:hypothetical protein